jgi:type IV pilus assembly protein PilO
MAGLPKGQREQALLLVCILAVAAIGLYWNFVYSPNSADLDKKQERVESLVAVNQKAKAEMARGNLDELRRQLAEYQEHLTVIRTLVPSGNEVPLLLDQISTAARRVGLDVTAVDPQPVRAGSNYDTYRYGITVIGGYHALAQFFTNVGSLSRIILPTDVSLQVSANSNAQLLRARDNAAVVEARFQLQTFVSRAMESADTDAPRTMKGAKS